jgi:hypothetical protein
MKALDPDRPNREDSKLNAETQTLRQISATGIPSAHCFNMNAFWTSENREAFIALRSFQPGNLSGKTLPKNDPTLRPQIRSMARDHA